MFYLSNNHKLIMVINDKIWFVPMVDENSDYQHYLSWVAEGNTAEPWNDTPTEITPLPGG